MQEALGYLVQTDDGSLTACHPDYDEAFHSKQGALTEAESLYRDASGFAEHMTRAAEDEARWGVLDLGLGLGYNALMTIETWWRCGGPVDLELISLEHTALLVKALADTACEWKQGWSPEWRQWSQSLDCVDSTLWRASWRHPQSGRELKWQVQVGDARQANLPEASLLYIWQDAFSPKKNPELWTPEWFAKLRRASRPDVCLVTYSVARVVKDSLHEAGWEYRLLKASQHKKQWLRAQLSAKV